MFEAILQPMHLLVIFVVALLVFGPRKLPELGEAISKFKGGPKGGSPTHPLPVTGPVETSRGVKAENPPDSPKHA